MRTARPLGWTHAWRIARRDLQIGFRGLRLLFICLLLGVGTLAAIGSLTAAVAGEIAARGQLFLGGDVEIVMTQREAGDEELRALRQIGTVSGTIRLRAMAQADGATPVLTELKGVDRAYPLYGTLDVQDGTFRPLAAGDMLISPALGERLGIGRGDRLSYGGAEFTVVGLIANEPDRVGEGFTLGPVAIVSLDGLRRTGLIQPGSLFTSKYRVRLPPGADAAAVRSSLEQRHASAGWEIKDRDGAAPGTTRFFERMGQFLSLIGLAALTIAGIGVGNGIASYLGLKRGAIATLKILGATASDIERIYLLQLATVALAAIGCGLITGVLIPPLAVSLAGDVLPVKPGFTVHPLPLLTSAVYGVLVALIFAVPQLAKARVEPAAAIFRELVEQRRVRDSRAILIVAMAAAAMVAIVLGTAREPAFAAGVLAATAAVVLLLAGVGRLVSECARRAPQPRNPLLRLAITNLHRPGSQTPALVVALGLALTLFVTLAAIQTSIESEIERTVPATAPDLFVLDIPSTAQARFRTLVDQQAPGARFNLVPALRGTVVEYGGRRVADLKDRPEGAWILRGERGVTFSASLPEGSELAAGEWWPPDYQGPPLISLDAAQANALGVGVGDMISVSVLGREIQARIASLRYIDWRTMGFNYVLVFSPNALAGAPHSLTATLTLPPGTEAGITRTLVRSFPAASVIQIGDVVERVVTLLRQMAAAIIATGSITILAGMAVLVGAIAASRQARSYDSVILKTLGATRRQILGTHALEYGMLAGVLAAISLLLGSAAAWFVIVEIFEFSWAADWAAVLVTLAGGALLTLGLGLVGSIPTLSVRPAQALRQL